MRPRHLAGDHGLNDGRQGKVVTYDFAKSATLRCSGCVHFQRVLGHLIEAVVAVVAASVGLPPSDPTQVTPEAAMPREHLCGAEGWDAMTPC